jgi:hypothetical protein
MKKKIIPLFLLFLLLPFSAIFAGDSIASFFPEDALVYLQSRDMVSLIDSYNASDFGRKYLETAAFKDFGDSKLYLKLEERVGNWEKLTGFKLHINNVREFAGSESAAAVYNIGDIQILFATQITYPQASKSKLFKLKSSFEVKRKDDIEYYVKQSGEVSETFAFGYVKNVLLISTDIALFEKALDLIKGKSSASLANFDKFKQSAASMDGDLIMFADIGKLVSDTYFRSYWIYRNISSLKWIQYSAAALNFESCGANEKRIYIPFPGSAPMLKPLSADGLIKMLPGEYDYFFLSSAVSPDEVTDSVLSNAWGLPVVATEEGARSERQKKLLELRTNLLNYIKKIAPSEKLDLVISEVGEDPFGANLSSPIMLLADKVIEDDIKKMLGYVSLWFSTETSFKESNQYPVKSTTGNGWKFFYLETPIYLSETYTIGYNSNAVVFMRGIGNISKFGKAAQSQGFDPQSVSFSRLSFSKTGGKFFKLFDLLKNAPGWPGSERKDLFSENLRSLFKLFDKIREITTTDKIEGNKIVRSVVYSCR